MDLRFTNYAWQNFGKEGVVVVLLLVGSFFSLQAFRFSGFFCAAFLGPMVWRNGEEGERGLDLRQLRAESAGTMTLLEIKEEIPRLTLEERFELTETLVALSEPDVEEAWKMETRRRIAEMESGAVKGIDSDVAMAELWKRTHP